MFEKRERERVYVSAKFDPREENAGVFDLISRERRTRTKTETKEQKAANDDFDKKLALRTRRTPASDDFQKCLLVIFGQIRLRALQPRA